MISDIQGLKPTGKCETTQHEEDTVSVISSLLSSSPMRSESEPVLKKNTVHLSPKSRAPRLHHPNAASNLSTGGGHPPPSSRRYHRQKRPSSCVGEMQPSEKTGNFIDLQFSCVGKMRPPDFRIMQFV